MNFEPDYQGGIILNFHSLNKKPGILRRVLTISFCFVFLLTGCGNKEELENYKANMNQFFENIKVFDSSINAIDPESDTAVSELLSYLDSMDKSFAFRTRSLRAVE